MKAYEETIDFSAANSIKIFKRIDKSFSFEWHYHDAYELTYIISGRGQRYVGDSLEPFEAGDLVLLPPNLPHTWVTDVGSEVNEALVVQFSQKVLGDSGELKQLRDLLLSTRGISFKGSLLAKIVKGLKGKEGVEKYICLLNALFYLSKLEQTELCSIGYSPDLKTVSREKMDALHAFLQRSSGSFLSSDLAEELNMSESTLRRFVKRNTGKSLVDYSNELRVARCCVQLIENRHLSISHIALENGFGNLSNFNRVFKKIKNLTPREFRS
ncbi:MAG: helix-turn-helix domain-containing protein [Lentisphaeraceae bacterium]|nr:helix-turn-helix domain-containing protein [Lentisphaeraceae bacterium]